MNFIFPSVALSAVERIFIVVLFPAPLGPKKPNISPLFTSKEIPLTT